MRCAVIVAPWDPQASDAEIWSDAVARLGASLARLGFRVSVVDGGDDFEGQLATALAGVAADDEVLVHVSGRLARRGVLRVAHGEWLSLRAFGDMLASLVTAPLSLLAELLHEDDADDVLVAADHITSVVAALGVRERGHGLIAAVRPVAAPVEGLALTTMILRVADAARRGEAQPSAVYASVTAMSECRAVAQSFICVPGRAELDLAPPPPAPVELDALIEAATEGKDWLRAADLRLERLARLDSPRQRVRELVAIARILQAELNDPDGAIDALEQARSIEPRRVPVLQALRRGYETLGRWASAIEVTGALADLAPTPIDRAALRFAQARITLERLQDEERARVWLEQALADDPSHAEAGVALARVLSSLASPEPAPLPPEPEPEPEPGLLELDPARYARAFAARRAEGRTDAALLAAMSLEELGAADADVKAFLDPLRSVSPIRARGTLDADAWRLLRPAESDDVLRALFGWVARAAVLARLEQLVARSRLVVLDPTHRLDEASTASVVRTFEWAARVLGVPRPTLYAVDQVPGEIAAVRQREPTTAVGPSVVRGRSAKDLAFLAGRHLTYYVLEHQVLVYFPTLEELMRLLLAAAQLAKPGAASTGEDSRAIAALAARLDRHVTDQERAGIIAAVRALEARGGRFSLGAWTRSAELMATRAGFLLCGDLATAMAVVRAESRGIAGLTTEAKRRDLVAFCASAEHIELRARWVVTAAESLPAPPWSAAQPA
jgi:tetratricopeptide (TPR) repeat protein